MHSTHYLLHPKSGGWIPHSDAHASEYRLVHFDMTAERRGKRLGGNNIQTALGAPDQIRAGLNDDVALWLPSGWWVTLRNQFAQAPDIGLRVVESVADELSAITADATAARGADAEAVTRKLFSMTFHAVGPDYWP